MKRIKTFEQFVNENYSANAVPASLAKLGEWTPIEIDDDILDGTDYSKAASFELKTGTGLDDIGVILNVYDDKDFSIFFDSAPIALSAHSSNDARSMAQTMAEVPLPLSKLNKKELDKIISDLKSSYLGEALSAEQKMGPKATKFTRKIEEWDWFNDANEMDEPLPEEWHEELVELRIKADEAIVCFFDAVGSASEVIRAAKSIGLVYAQVEDTMAGSDGIVFSAKQ